MRRAGVLLHVTSLSGPRRTGTFGNESHEFAEFCARSGLRTWQLLPLQATTAAAAHSPYATISAFAIDPRLGEESDDKRSVDESERRAFRERHAAWLEDFALFAALRAEYERRPWHEWPCAERDREPGALDAARRRHSASIERTVNAQFHVRRLWDAVRRRCAGLGVELIGDLPFYVRHDSADVWVNRELFKLDEAGHPTCQAGVPPDYFSETGQLWGVPVYDWAGSRSTGHAWWIARLRYALELYDRLRLDHFRGFAATWAVPAGHVSATHGAWSRGPGNDLFIAAARRFPLSGMIAEDLGDITDDVRRLQREWRFPGMYVLQFGFGDEFPDSLHLPHRHTRRALVCSGTHDNNTARGWYEDDADDRQRANLDRYLGRRVDASNVAGELVRLALSSVADTAVLPAQDLLGLGSEGRMNRPGVAAGNWGWRLEPGRLETLEPERLRESVSAFGRL